MLLVVTDAMLTEDTRVAVIQDLMTGVRSRDADVVLVESLTEVGISGQSSVLSLWSTESKDGLRGAANGAAAVIYVSLEAAQGARTLLGLSAGSGYQVPLANVVVSDLPVEGARKLREAENALFQKVHPVRTKRRIRALRSMGKTFGRFAAEPMRLDAADRDVRMSAVAEVAESKLKELLEMEDVEEFQIVGGEAMFVQKSGGDVIRKDSPYASEQHLIDQLKFIAGARHTRFDPMFPRLDVPVGGSWRLHGEAWVVKPAHMVLRSNMAGKRKLETLNVACPELNAVLDAAVCGGIRANMIVAATMGGGKTTLCQALLSGLPDDERVDTIEDTPELKLRQYGVHDFTFERLTRSPNADGVGGHTMDDHIRDAKRGNAAKLVVGEVRGEGTLALLDAMSTGMSGCLATLHSQPGTGVMEKLASYAMGEGAEPAYARRQIGSGVHLLVWLGMNSRVERIVADVTEITGVDGNDQITSQTLWRHRPGERWANPVNMPQTERMRRIYEEVGISETVEAAVKQRQLADERVPE